MGDSDYGSALAETLEKPPPPEAQSLTSSAKANMENNKVNGQNELSGHELMDTRVPMAGISSSSNNINDNNNNNDDGDGENADGGTEPNARSNGDFEPNQQGDHNDSSNGHQSDLDLRLNHSTNSSSCDSLSLTPITIREEDGRSGSPSFSAAAAAPPPLQSVASGKPVEDRSNTTGHADPAFSIGSSETQKHDSTLATAESTPAVINDAEPPESHDQQVFAHVVGSSAAAAPTASAEKPAIGASGVAKLATLAAVQVEQSSRLPLPAASSESGNGSGEPRPGPSVAGLQVPTMATQKIAAKNSAGSVRSTSPEIGESAPEKTPEEEVSTVEDVVTIVVMEKDEEEMASENDEDDDGVDVGENRGELRSRHKETTFQEPMAAEGHDNAGETANTAATTASAVTGGAVASNQPEAEPMDTHEEEEGEEIPPKGDTNCAAAEKDGNADEDDDGNNSNEDHPSTERMEAMDNEATRTSVDAAASVPIDSSDGSSREAEQAESSFLILDSDHSSGESGAEETSARTQENGDIVLISTQEAAPDTSSAPTAKVAGETCEADTVPGSVPPSQPSPEEINDERFAEIESLVAAFDGSEENSRGAGGGSTVKGQPTKANQVTAVRASAEIKVEPETVSESSVATPAAADAVIPGAGALSDLGSGGEVVVIVHKKRGRKTNAERERLAKLAEAASGIISSGSTNSTQAAAAPTDAGLGGGSSSSGGRRSKSDKLVVTADVKTKSVKSAERDVAVKSTTSAATGKELKCEARKKLSMSAAAATAVAADVRAAEASELPERRIQKARRTGGAPTKKEFVKTELGASGSGQAETSTEVAGAHKEAPSVVGNGKLRVHGYDRVCPLTNLPELVTVNREALERIVSEQNSQLQRLRAKLKDMYKVCDDLRKVVMIKGLQEAVLTPEEAAIPVDVIVRVAQLPPKVPRASHTVKVQRTANGNYDLHEEGLFHGRVLPVKKWLGVVHAPKAAAPLALGADRKITPIGPTLQHAKCKVDFNVKALPKDIVRALTNGDVLTAQQRQRFIDKISMDILKAKGVPQPNQIQEIARQVANMYPRSLVILPEGKRKSNLRRKRGESDDMDGDDASEQSVAKRPRIAQPADDMDPSLTQTPPTATPKEAREGGTKTSSAKGAAVAAVPASAKGAAVASEPADCTPIAKRRGRPPKHARGMDSATHSSPASVPATTFTPNTSTTTTTTSSSVKTSKSPAPTSQNATGSACNLSASLTTPPVTATKSLPAAPRTIGVAASKRSIAAARGTAIAAKSSPRASASTVRGGVAVSNSSSSSASPKSVDTVGSKSLVVASKSFAAPKVSSSAELLASMFKASPARERTKSIKASLAPGSLRMAAPESPTTSQQPAQGQATSGVSSSPRKVNGPPTPAGSPVVAKKRGRPRKDSGTPSVATAAAAAATTTVASPEELLMTPEEQKAWLRQDLQRPPAEQDLAKQDRLLLNCYDLLYREMAEKDYDVIYITNEWPALRKPHHVLSVFKLLKKVDGGFQDRMRRDAPKLVTFLHERVTSEEGAEWSLAISQAKPGPRHQLPEEVGVMPLLALNFEEDFSLLFKLVPDEGALQAQLAELGPQPVIIGVGCSIFDCEYHVVIERQQLFSPRPTTFLDALELLFAAYFVFNLAYPRELSNTLEYVQRYYVGYNPHIKTVTLAHTRPRIANFIKKMKDFERLDWNANNIRANSPGVPSDFERESDLGDDENIEEAEPMVEEDANVNEALPKSHEQNEIGTIGPVPPQ